MEPLAAHEQELTDILDELLKLSRDTSGGFKNSAERTEGLADRLRALSAEVRKIAVRMRVLGL